MTADADLYGQPVRPQSAGRAREIILVTVCTVVALLAVFYTLYLIVDEDYTNTNNNISISKHDGVIPPFLDSDGDGLPDIDEVYRYGTDRYNPDTDGDGMSDGWELHFGLGPLDPVGDNGPACDPDGDGYTSLQEFEKGTDPKDPSSHPGT